MTLAQDIKAYNRPQLMITDTLSAGTIAHKLYWGGLFDKDLKRTRATLKELAAAGVFKINFPMNTRDSVFHHAERLQLEYETKHQARPY